MWSVFLVKSKAAVVIVFLVVCFLVLALLVPVCFAVSVDEASVAIGQAERDLSSAYTNVSAAAGSGANVTVLLDKLTEAGSYLSEANVAYRVGNYESAFSYAESCSSAVQGVAGDATRLSLSAENSRSGTVLLDVVESGVGLALLLVFGLLGWRFLSKRYRRRVLDLRPVVRDCQ